MNIPHQSLIVDIYRIQPLTVDLVGHELDKNTRYLDLQLTANGIPITLTNCTATVTYVSDNILLEQDVSCDIVDSVLQICFDKQKITNARSGILRIQPTITDENTNKLTLQTPIYIRVAADIARTSGVDDNSLGSYAEVVQEIAAARGNYQNLNERLSHASAPTDETVYIANLVSNSRTIAGIDLQDDITAAELKSALNVPNPTNYYTKSEINQTFVDLSTFNSELDDIDSEITAKADKSDTYTKAEVNAAIQTAIGGVENGSY